MFIESWHVQGSWQLAKRIAIINIVAVAVNVLNGGDFKTFLASSVFLFLGWK